jgi:hypothetical protein
VSTNSSYAWRKQLMWGLLLIGFGTAFFLDRIGYLEFRDFWHYWPLVLVVFGVNKMIGFPTAKDFTSGLWLVVVGIWIFFTSENMFGLTYMNSWPLLIIAYGIILILEPFIKTRFPAYQESNHDK